MIPTDVRDEGRRFTRWFREQPAPVASLQPFSAVFGVTVKELDPEDGFAKLEYEVRPDYCNFLGKLHGGVIAALLDDAAGVAACVLVGQGFRGTVGSTITYLSPARPGKVMTEAKIIKYNRSHLFCEASLFSDGELRARSSSIMLYGNLKPEVEAAAVTSSVAGA